ncbi:uncharacterized protein K452DRAFT_301568 [Aplosporella prunicola CBS 121167]|uniref:Uncharacterized protein n=1 Tax=Aplosporella prunicola CBS 121167 TaxID=1176127 RepID=A0A6A6B4F3_9PEZI|nr:uncharacterized protein K452DRAFT_301568 [Aplosporella prunicola CBS 121167]KAF2137837.1 hypothetical protein K452DRAFT_301568 [Aplosporella prunicola CBS 121167]
MSRSSFRRQPSYEAGQPDPSSGSTTHSVNDELDRLDLHAAAHEQDSSSLSDTSSSSFGEGPLSTKRCSSPSDAGSYMSICYDDDDEQTTRRWPPSPPPGPPIRRPTIHTANLLPPTRYCDGVAFPPPPAREFHGEELRIVDPGAAAGIQYHDYRSVPRAAPHNHNLAHSPPDEAHPIRGCTLYWQLHDVPVYLPRLGETLPSLAWLEDPARERDRGPHVSERDRRMLYRLRREGLRGAVDEEELDLLSEVRLDNRDLFAALDRSMASAAEETVEREKEASKEREREAAVDFEQDRYVDKEQKSGFKIRLRLRKREE